VLLNLDAFKIFHDRLYVAGAKYEDGHVWMARDDALGSAKFSTGYLLERVRKGGACGCGLSPVLPTAWQREQFSRTSSSPLVSVPFSTAAAGFETTRNSAKT
jgi:hypothetical protein